VNYPIGMPQVSIALTGPEMIIETLSLS